MDKLNFQFFKIALNSDILQFWGFLGRFRVFLVKMGLFWAPPPKPIPSERGRVFFFFYFSSMGRVAPRGPAGPPFATATTPWAHLVRCTHGVVAVELLSRLDAFFSGM